MKNKIKLLFLFAAAFLFLHFVPSPPAEPWTKAQLLEPAQLADALNHPQKPQWKIYNIGFGGGIKNSIDVGAARDEVNIKKFKAELEKLPRNTPLVIYCGCCPFEHCPNIRPAFTLLNDMKFTNQKLLNLSHNLNKDWIAKGYPENK